MKMRVTTHSHSRCRVYVRVLRSFFKFISSVHPSWRDWALLSRKDMEDFLVWYRSYSKGNHETQRDYIISLQIFLEYIQRAEYKESPKLPTNLLIFREYLPQLPVKAENQIKFIPEGVLRQLDENLEYLSPVEYIPVVILLRATGWRISDILNLRYANCLVQTEQGWYLCEDILKTQVLNHRVPITDEVAQAV